MKLPLALRTALFAALALAAPAGRAAEAAAVSPPYHLLINPAPGMRKSTPTINAASDEGLNAIQRIKPAGGLEIKLWAAEPMLANPVAFTIDERGRIFVAETYRYRSSTLDIRDYLWMDQEDLASRTIEDRQAMLLRNFGPEGIKELSVESEIVRLIEDTDGDGVADRSSVYADGFNRPLDGVAAGVLARRGEVWFADIPSIWKMTGERKAETRTEVSRGYGIHFSLTGHDLHGLTWGPDGKIYFSFGDRSASVKTKEGTTINTQDMGGVYRMNPDGTQLEMFADGLRNPQSLLFTENGDMVIGDNDSDQPDEERLVHVVEGGDAGWRIGYQRPPLAPTEIRGPWAAERMWLPRWEGQPAFMLPPICNIEDGNSGIAYYPGTGLNSSYFGQIFICHFKGSFARSGVNTYLVKPNGASYEIADSKVFVSSVLPTDIRFGPDGRVYISDWTDSFAQTKKGRIYTISDPQHVNDPLVKETQQLIAGDWTKRSPDELAKLLSHADWRVRLEAQYTLAERGVDSIPVLARVATTPAPAAGELGNAANLPAFARRHAIWGLGQIAQKSGNALTLATILARSAAKIPFGVKDSPALAPLRALLHDADPEVRTQAIKVLGEHCQTDQADNFIAALKDEHGRVKFQAAIALGKFAAVEPAIAARATTALFDALRANNDVDHYLRHACVVGLVGCKNIAALTAVAGDRSRAVRLGAILTLRRLERPEIAQFLNDSDPYLVRETALAINDRPINAAMPALAALIADGVADPRFVSHNAAGQVLADEPVLYRAINAAFRVGSPADAAALAKFAVNPEAPQKFRLEALTQLSLWPNPPQRDRLMGLYRPLAAQARNATATTSRDGKSAADALAPMVATLLDPASPAAIQTAAIAAIGKLHIPTAADALFNVVRNEKQPDTNRATALTALGATNDRDPRLPEVVKMASAASASVLRLAALPIAAKLSPADAAPVLANFVAKGDVAEQKAAFYTLGTLKHPSADAIFVEQLKLLAADKVAPAVQLELLEGAEKRDHPEIKKLLAERAATLAANADPIAAFRFALHGGDREKGQRIFENQPVLACVRCHRIGTAGGGDGAPNLADAGTKHPREYILESIVKPNAKIAPGFDTIVVTRKSGGVAAGIVATETPDVLTLRDIEGKPVEVKKSDIAKRDAAPSAMPEIYAALLSKTELRDLVEFIGTIGVPLPGGRGGRGGGGRGAGGGGLRALRGLTPISLLTPPPTAAPAAEESVHP